MKELSMHILDITMNSIKAEASLVEIKIEDSKKNNNLTIAISDNGNGMSEEVINKVTNPFYTSRTTRKVGLGIPMLKEACERCSGYLKIESKVGLGTTVFCSFERDNIDRAPLGNMGETIMTIINSADNIELLYNHKTDSGEFTFDTREVKEMLDDIDINDISILLWIKEYINENVNIVLNR
ncbi:MAG: ATP-binding protein [Sedimentibacter sp.]|nr:ATP-binding protein [Sedimentibacter sp.]HNZ82537.1 ATP-binding protein [Sedimentibacter sp.]